MAVLWIALLVLGATPDGGIADGGMPAVPAEWAAQKTPRKGPAASVGGYSAGCLQGAAALPHSGPGYELLHLGRHRSHQTGLDADVGFAFPDWALRRPPTAEERESVMPPPVVDLAAGKLNERWGPRVAHLLELAASDPVVDRIFVNPVIKRELCAH